MKAFLKQIGELPSIAGLAKLEYNDINEPTREGDVITLPHEGWDIYQLNNDFSQFLALKTITEAHDTRHYVPRKAWFGGTDELPFLVELSNVCDYDSSIENGDWVTIWRKGLLYEALKPRIISKYEKSFGKDQTKRQGDMFCYPMPVQDWEQLLCILESVKTQRLLVTDLPYSKQMSDLNPICVEKPKSLYNTRHELTGCYTHTNSDYIIGQGTIKAPDHTDLNLSDICIIAQTRNLMNGEKAD